MPIPPWLNIQPSDYTSAAQAGAQLGLGARRQQFAEQTEQTQQDFEQQRLQQSAAEAAGQLALKKQGIAAAERQHAREVQLRQDMLMSNFMREQTQQSVAQAYHQAQLGLAKNRLDLEGQKLQQSTQQAAAQLTQKQQAAAYKQAHPEVTNAELMALFPGVPPNFIAAMDKTGKSGTDETITRRTNIDAAPAVPPTPGQPASPGYLGGWLFGLGKHPAIPATPGSPATLKGELTESVKVPPGTDPATAFRAAQPAAPAPVQPAPATTAGKQFTDKSGAVFAYTGSSDDPTADKDPSHWRLIAQ